MNELTIETLSARFDALYALFRRVLLLATIIGLGALLGIGIFVLAVQRAANDSQDAVDQVVAQRTEAREATCVKDKRFAEAHNRLVIAIATGGGTHEIPEETQAAVDANTVDVPSCTPEGIRDFYEGGKP